MVLSMERWEGKVAIVTGASSGIGASIAEHLVIAGLLVVGLARRKERMEKLSRKLSDEKGKLFAYQTDVTKEDDILDAFKWAVENLGPIHILVNCAGIVQPTTLIDGDTEMWKKVIYTNIIGLSIATREAVKNMMQNKVDGHIIHINSIFGHTIPNVSKINMYPATKHAITALTEVLRQELNAKRSKIKISSISPGYVDTELSKANNMGIWSEIFMKFLPLLQPNDVADAAIYILSTPPHVQVHDLIIKPVGESV